MPERLDIISRPVANIEAPTAASAISELKQDITPKLAQLVTGQLLKGEVLSKLMDGSFTVRVAGITAKMLLPEGSKTGDQIPLRLVGTNPRPTFLLENSGDVPAHTALLQNYNPNAEKTTPSNTLRDYLASDVGETGVIARPQASPGKISPDSTPVKEDASAVVTLSKNVDSGSKIASDIPDAIKPSGTQQLATARASEINVKAPLVNTPAPELATDKNSSTPTSLSSTAKFIDQILQTQHPQGPKTSIASQDPILSTLANLKDTITTATKLQNQISASGLFYESHVAEWAQGQRPIADIRSEPQSQISPTQTGSSDQTSSTLPVNKELGQIIHQQLNVLEQNIVRWQGELFPGQKIEWEIKKETPEKRNTQAQEEVNWQSVVRFNLPSLGQVTATLNFRADTLGLSLRAEQSDTVAALKNHASELSAALQVAGSPLMSFVVNKDE